MPGRHNQHHHRCRSKFSKRKPYSGIRSGQRNPPASRARAPTSLHQSCPLRARKTKITKAFSLPTQAVIHTVGPKDKRPTVLKQCYRNSLKTMALNEFRTIAFPSIATGAYGYPPEEASLLAVTEIISWITEGTNRQAVDLILFCAHTSQEYATHHRTLTALHDSYLAHELSKTSRPSRQLKQLEHDQPASLRQTLEHQERASKRSRSGERLHNQQSDRPTASAALIPSRIPPTSTQEISNYTRTQAPTPSEISVFSRPAREVSRQLGLGRQEARSLSKEWDRRERTKSPSINSLTSTHQLHSDSRPPRHSRLPSEANSTHTAQSFRNSTSSRPQWRTQTQTQPAPSLIESSITRTRSRSNSRSRQNPDLSVTQQIHVQSPEVADTATLALPIPISLQGHDPTIQPINP